MTGVFACEHGRLPGQPCPHCLGFSAAQRPTVKMDFVPAADWDTKWPQRAHNFVAKSGFVSPGPVTPMKTDFGTLTYGQTMTLKAENEHYIRREYEGKVMGKLGYVHWVPH